eukprot:1289962-Pleurochrysis_carterae.AAC.1
MMPPNTPAHEPGLYLQVESIRLHLGEGPELRVEQGNGTIARIANSAPEWARRRLSHEILVAVGKVLEEEHTHTPLLKLSELMSASDWRDYLMRAARFQQRQAEEHARTLDEMRVQYTKRMVGVLKERRRQARELIEENAKDLVMHGYLTRVHDAKSARLSGSSKRRGSQMVYVVLCGRQLIEFATLRDAASKFGDWGYQLMRTMNNWSQDQLAGAARATAVENMEGFCFSLEVHDNFLLKPRVRTYSAGSASTRDAWVATTHALFAEEREVREAAKAKSEGKKRQQEEEGQKQKQKKQEEEEEVRRWQQQKEQKEQQQQQQKAEGQVEGQPRPPTGEEAQPGGQVNEEGQRDGE